jgi:GNAT superfamily N-acetyltransferase
MLKARPATAFWGHRLRGYTPWGGLVHLQRMQSFEATITRATAADIAALAPLFDAYRMFFTQRERIDESLRFLADRFAREETVVFMAWAGGDALGFIQLYPLWSSWYCRRIWFVSDLYVKESARKHGLGQRLVERVKAYADETLASSVMVELPHVEPHLAAFYAKLGFHRDDVFDLARYVVKHTPDTA